MDYRDDRDRPGRERPSGHRDFMERAGDEIRSWFGDDQAVRRRRMDEMRDRGDFDRDRGSAPRRAPREPGRGHRVHDWMTRHVATVHPSDPIEHAARLMYEHDCGGLPVVQGNGRLIGMITDRDLVVRLLARGRDPLRSRVEDAMTEDVYSVRMGEDAEAVLDLMARHQVRRIPVVDDRDRIVGMLSQADVVRHARTQEIRPVDVAETISEISEPGRR